MQYIDTAEALESARVLIVSAPWAAIDTEADSLHHYIEKLCLIQISIPEHDFVIDPLAGLDLKALGQTLCERPLLFHGADFDIRMVRRGSGAMPQKGMFDTMLAAQLLGYDRQSLADLVKKHCDIELSKSSQKADWSRRPLTDKMLDYAVNDTLHLKKISDIMRDELKELGRLDWHRQACERLVKSLAATPEQERQERENAWQVKGSKELKGRALTILKELWRWREDEAKRRDRPSFKVLNTEYLVEVAKWAAENLDKSVADMPTAPRNVRGELSGFINDIVKKTEGLPQAIWAAKKFAGPRTKWTDKNQKDFLAFKEARERLGKELKLLPSLIATNAILEDLTLDCPKDREHFKRLDYLMPWQAEVLTEPLLEIINKTP